MIIDHPRREQTTIQLLLSHLVNDGSPSASSPAAPFEAETLELLLPHYDASLLGIACHRREKTTIQLLLLSHLVNDGSPWASSPAAPFDAEPLELL